MPRSRRHRGPVPLLALVLAAAALLMTACGSGGDRVPDGAGGPVAGASASPGAPVGGADGDVPAEDANGDPGGVANVSFTRFDGGQGTFAAYRGKPLVVNFFASWCAPCVREMPEIERVHEELGDQVTFVGVDVRDRLEEGRKLAEQTAVSYELVRDPGGDVLTAFGGALLPTTAFVTAEGRIVLLQNHTYDAGELRAAIHEELLG